MDIDAAAAPFSAFEPHSFVEIPCPLDHICLSSNLKPELNDFCVHHCGGHALPADNNLSAEHAHPSQRFFKIFAISLAALVLLVMTSVAVLYTPWMQDEIIRHGLKRIEQWADVQIEAGDCRLSPLTVMRIESLRVTSGDREFIVSDRVEIAFQLQRSWPYLSPRLVLFDKPAIYLEKDQQGRWRIPKDETAAFHGRVPLKGVTRWRDFSWPEVRVRSARIVAWQNGEIILSLHNLNGTIPYRVVSVAGEPTFIIDLGRWR
jgi:hypothetical protein